MQPIVNLITTLTTQAQSALLPALLVLVVVVAGFFFMTGDHRAGRSTLLGGLIGASIVLGATTLATLVKA